MVEWLSAFPDILSFICPQPLALVAAAAGMIGLAWLLVDYLLGG